MASRHPPASGFDGFPQSGLAFLAELSAEQNRDWFLANKARYETDVLGPMTRLMSAVVDELAKRDLPFRGDPSRSIFRIHRDVRFSRDKRPYKTHMGAALTREGVKLAPGVLYIHIDPAGSFVAAGFYQPEPAILGKLRDHIVAHVDDYRCVIAGLSAHQLALRWDEDSLKRLPTGFEQVVDPDIQDALKRKTFVTGRDLDQSMITSPDLVDSIATFASQAMPLLAFGWSAIGP